MMPQRALTDTQLVDEQGVKTRLGVKPNQVIDYKALVGDSSDNYPGIPGIGPTTAVNLLNNFADFEEILEAVNKEDAKIKPAVAKKILAGIDSGKLSKQLATIRTDVPLEVNVEAAVIPEEEKMVEVFKQLGHRSLIRRVSGENVELDDSQQKLFE
jgi:DNA polymerase-1